MNSKHSRGEYGDMKVPEDVAEPARLLLQYLLEEFTKPSDGCCTVESKTGITFVTKDGKLIKTQKSYFGQSLLLKNFFQRRRTARGYKIPLDSISSKPLAKVLEWCKRHTDDDYDSGDGLKSSFQGDKSGYYLDGVSKDDLEYVSNMDMPELIEVILVADFFRFDALTQLLSRAMANGLKGKPTEEIRRVFGLEDGLRAIDEKQIRLLDEYTIPSEQRFDST